MVDAVCGAGVQLWRATQRLSGVAQQRQQTCGPRGAIGTTLLLAAICFYGGFFNAGLGIILLAFLVLAGYKDINGMNGIKLWLSTLVSLTAVIRLAIGGSIFWQEGSVALVGATLGGYLAARLSYLIPSIYVRRFVIVYGLGLTVYFFWQVYG